MPEPDWDQLAEDYGLDRHPEADKLIVSTHESGRCICAATLPPMTEWDGYPHPWASTTCAECGRCYVDEDEYIAIYDEGCDTDG